jgi:hypothetical protein
MIVGVSKKIKDRESADKITALEVSAFVLLSLSLKFVCVFKLCYLLR